ncbi:MAG: MFS transporter [Prevotellaceae bacterium]|nr:MFS transporter [Prevotellaceae bacterium]
MDRKTNYRWVICGMLFFAVVVNYMDRQVLSLTWKDFIATEFHWSDSDYGTITGLFSLVYAVGMLFAGRFIDYLGTKRGYVTAIAVWSTGACLHAFCGILTCGIVSGDWVFSFLGARRHLLALQGTADFTLMITTISVWMFIVARAVLSIGESGNFPCAIKAVSEYFPKKDRGFATGIFNSGAQIGALIAPFTIPLIARRFGWETAFLVIGALGYIWLFCWIAVYRRPSENPRMNAAELAYIEQDAEEEAEKEAAAKAAGNAAAAKAGEAHISPFKAFTFRQTWAVVVGRFLPDSVWWFLLFWAPAFISEVYGYSSDTPQGMFGIFIIYLISMLSLAGSYLPTWFINHGNVNPYQGRMRGMLIFALFPLLGCLVMPAGSISMWFPVIIIGIMAAAHQSWSANVYNVVSDMFPKTVVATVTGAAGLASGLGCFIFNKGAGLLFDYTEAIKMQFFGFGGKQAGYMIVFLIASVAYLLSWCVMKLLVPKYKLVQL